MSIRIRKVGGRTVALCGYETDAHPGDHYIDDGEHYALAAKFAQDWRTLSGGTLPEYPEEWAVMETQKLRDAATRDDLGEAV